MFWTRCQQHLRTRIKAGKYGWLAIEITIALIIKVSLLYLIWAICFAHPIAKDARQSAVTRMILNNPD